VPVAFFAFRSCGVLSKEKMQPPGLRDGRTRGERLLSASDDQADVERVLAGDVDAFESIVHRWNRPLINLAYRFCRDRGRAEELAQEAFLRAYRALHQWRKDAAFRPGCSLWPSMCTGLSCDASGEGSPD
jgi:sigma-70-like protein